MRPPVRLLALALLTAGCAGGPPVSGAGTGETGIAELRAGDLRLATITDRLARAAEARCPERVGTTGLVVSTADQFDAASRLAIAAGLGLEETAGVVAVVPGSAADRAGVRAGDRLVAVDGEAAPVATAGPATFSTTRATLDLLDRAAADGALALTVARGGGTEILALAPPPACRVRPIVTGGGEARASTDGVNLKVSAGLLAEAPDDDELAAVVAHELAHIVLGHRAAIDAGRARVRDTEEAADALSVALLAEAGIDPAAAARFWRRFGPAHAPLFGDPKHGGWRGRVARIETAIARLPDAARAPISGERRH